MSSFTPQQYFYISDSTSGSIYSCFWPLRWNKGEVFLIKMCDLKIWIIQVEELQKESSSCETALQRAFLLSQGWSSYSLPFLRKDNWDSATKLRFLFCFFLFPCDYLRDYLRGRAEPKHAGCRSCRSSSPAPDDHIKLRSRLDWSQTQQSCQKSIRRRACHGP